MTSRTDPVVVLHVGTMKSGTTYLQARLEQHRTRLAGDGVLFPGPQWKDQLRAGLDGLARVNNGADLTDADSRWGRLRAQLLGWDGPLAIVSVEHLAKASADQARALVASLSPRPVRIVLTARALSRTIPAYWQQQVKAGKRESFEELVGALADPARSDTTLVRRFWRLHDVAAHAARWSSVVGLDAVRVVTVPGEEAEPDLLWQRFCAAAGLAADRYPALDADLRLNPSLGGAGAELLRRLNARLVDDLDQSAHRDVVKFTLGNLTLAGRDDDAPRRVPIEHQAWLRARSADAVDGLRASNVAVIGDLVDLLEPTEPPAGSGTPDTNTNTNTDADPLPSPEALADADRAPSPGALADATVRASFALLQRLDEADTALASPSEARSGRRGSRRTHTGAKQRRAVLGEQVRAARRRAAQLDQNGPL